MPDDDVWPADVREWVSFSDDEEQRTWIFDATYLRSNYTCIYGRGCKGVLDADATEMAQGCCSYGAHFVDDDDVANVVAHFVRVRPEHMQFYDKAVAKGFLAAGDDDADGNPVTVTRLVDDACIFLNRPDFAGGPGCALHVAAIEAGDNPLQWKPNVCWQVPIRLEHETDDKGYVVSRLRDWKRRDWGDGGADFHWWCTESPDAYVGDEPLYRSAAAEITELVGARVYAQLVEVLERPRPPALPEAVAVTLQKKR